MDPDTACNTHDLLECPCGGLGKSNPLEPIDTNLPAGKEDDEESEESDYEEKGFMAASQVKTETINKMDKAVSFCKVLPQLFLLTL